MNKDNIIKLADAVEKYGDFDMRDADTCILGVCDRRFGVGIEVALEMGPYSGGIDINSAKAKAESEQLDRLTTPNPALGDGAGWWWMALPDDPRRVTREHAAECLRLLAETGEVDYDEAHRRLRRRQAREAQA